MCNVYGCVRSLSALTGSPHTTVRLYSSWALRNLFYKSTGGVKRALMKVSSLGNVHRAMRHPHMGTHAQVAAMLGIDEGAEHTP